MRSRPRRMGAVVLFVGMVASLVPGGPVSAELTEAPVIEDPAGDLEQVTYVDGEPHVSPATQPFDADIRRASVIRRADGTAEFTMTLSGSPSLPYEQSRRRWVFDVLDEPRYPSFDEPSDARGLAVFVELTRAGLTSTSATLVDGNSGLRCETSTRIDGQVVRVSVGNVIGASRTIACFDHVGGLPTYWFGATAFANRGANLEWIDRTYAPRGDFDGPFATAEVVERTGRVAGADRYATAAGIGAREFPDGADVVYLARAVEPLVDALAGGMVADGPVLVVPPDGAVPPTVRAEVDRLDPDTVVALGGPAAISEPMLLAVADGRDTLRRSGANRYGTAVAVAQEQFPDGAPVVYLARAVEPLVDAVAGGTLSDGPVLLVPPAGQVPEVVTTEIARLDPATVVALGGPSAVGDDVLAAAAAGRERDRVAGDDRYDTAVRIAHRRGTGRTIYVARAVDPLIDAVAGGMVTDGPVLLVPPDGTLPEAVEAGLAGVLDGFPEDGEVQSLGGDAAVSDAMLAQVVRAALEREPIS